MPYGQALTGFFNLKSDAMKTASIPTVLNPLLRCRAPIAVMALALAGTTQAAVLTVTQGGDSGAGSLRAALASAAAGDTIVFGPGVTTVTLTGGELVINRSVTVKGRGVTVTAGYRHRVLRVEAQTLVRLEGLTVTGGALAGAGGRFQSAAGAVPLAPASTTPAR